MAELTRGDTAPAFTLDDQTGTPTSLASLGPGRVIVYFYPAALTPGCTIEAVDFSTHSADLSARGIRVVGISPDPVATLATFTAKNDLAITLLADPDRTAIRAYGAWGTRTLYGKKIEGVIRSTFLIGLDDAGLGTIAVADYNVRATGHVARLMKQL
jgi:peroxiredoxin Q/BCP